MSPLIFSVFFLVYVCIFTGCADCATANGIKYPWLTNQKSNRIRSSLLGFAPDSYSPVKFKTINYDDPTDNVNAAFDTDTDTELRNHPTFNYHQAMRKYWAILNPYEDIIDKPLKKWAQFAGDVEPDQEASSNDIQYAQVDTPEEVADLPAFDSSSLKQPTTTTEKYD